MKYSQSAVLIAY